MTTPDLHTFEHHWQDEADAAFLYRIMATAEPDATKRDVYQRLAEVEDRHVEIWADLLAKYGHTLPRYRPGIRTRMLAALGRQFGPGFLLPTRNHEVFKWCLDNELKLTFQMTLMTIGLYNEPSGAYMPSVLY